MLLFSLWCLLHPAGCPAHEDETSRILGSRRGEECAGIMQNGGLGMKEIEGGGKGRQGSPSCLNSMEGYSIITVLTK